MDPKLKKRLLKIDEQIEKLYLAEEKYLTLEAVKEHILAVKVSETDGPSEAAKKTIAMSRADYKTFKESLAHAKAEFHRQEHKYELIIKAFDAAYLSLKLEVPAINRQQ